MTKVLIVDDGPSYRECLHPLLSHAGYEVRTAADVAEALGVAEEFTPDVLVMDWMLRDEMDGLELAVVLRSTKPDMQMIFITGYPTDRLQAQIEAMPSASCLAKPFELSKLLAALREAAKRVDMR